MSGMSISRKKYYISSFFWGTLAKLITAVVNFISVPLLLGMYGNVNYGVLSLAQAANAYISLLDMGMNTGAVKFFSEWRAEDKTDLINKTARSNITFYIGIGILNSCILVLLALFGRNIFSVTEDQFLILRKCFFIIAFFSVFNWASTAFNQLLVSAEKVSFVNKMQCITVSLNVLAVILAVRCRLSLEYYFFLVVMISSLFLIPYLMKVIHLRLIDSVFPGWHWSSFKIVFLYSLNIFALSIFQMTASSSRPIVLGIFSSDAANISSEYRILTVFPNFILTIGGILSTLLLPKSSKALALDDKIAKENIAYKGTFITSVLANVLCLPFILCSKEVISAYVGSDYAYLSIPFIIWLLSVLYQTHSTPCNSLILATGKTKWIVVSTAGACVISVAMNIALCKSMGIMAAVLSYALYVFIVITAYYVFYYRKILELSGFRVFKSFLLPTLLGFFSLFITFFIPFDALKIWNSATRWTFVCKCFVKSSVWCVLYAGMLLLILLMNKKIWSLKK